MDGQETVEIYSLGRAALGGSEIAAWTGRDRACSVDGQETVGSSLGNAALGRSERGVELRWEGATENCRAVNGFFKTNSINAKDFSNGFQTLGDWTCIASLAGSDTKNAELLAPIFQDIQSTRLSRKTGHPRLVKVPNRWVMGHT